MNQIRQLLISILERMNLWEQNAKSIDELPISNSVVPSSKIHISDGGTSKSLELQKLLDASISTYSNQIISIGEIQLIGNEITIPIANWKIANVSYSTSSPTVITVPFSSAGTTRIDLIVADTLNQIYIVSGNDTVGISLRPNQPLNTVIVTEINVLEDAIASVPSILSENEIQALHGSSNPSSNNPFVTQSILTTLQENLQLKQPVVLAIDTNVNLAGTGIPVATIQGRTLLAGDRVILKNQSNPIENGIYRVNTTISPGNYKFFRTDDANATSELNNAIATVQEGTYAGRTYRQSTINPIIATSDIVFLEFGNNAVATIGTGIGTTVGTGETLMFSHKIPAGSKIVGNNISMETYFEKNNTLGICNVKIRLSTDGTVANSVVIAQNSGSQTSRWFTMVRNYCMVEAGNLIRVFNASQSFANDSLTFTTATSTAAFNPGNDYWILVTAQNANSGELTYLRMAKIN